MTSSDDAPPWLVLVAPWVVLVVGVAQSVARPGSPSDFALVSFSVLGIVVGAFTATVWNLRKRR